MKNRSLLILLTFFGFNFIYPQAPTGASGRPTGKSPTTAEMQQLDAELAAFQKEIEALSPEEQESFFKSMEEAVQKIDDLAKTEEGKALLERLDKGDISDEELDQLINQIVGDVEEPETIPTSIPEPTKPVEAPKPILTSKQEQTIDTINSIIAHTSAFLVKAASLPELPGKIKKWEKKKLIEWKPELTWNGLKADIELFISQLGHLLDRDQKTKAYYHIDELLKDEPLLNNLKKIQHVVSQNEPFIEEMSPLRTMRSSKASKEAFQKMITQYSEALYTLNIVDEIKKLLTKFEPTAKAARESEEKALQKAELERKRKLVPGAPITVGTPESSYAPSRMREDDYELYSPRSSRTYEPSYRDPFADLARPTDSKVSMPKGRDKTPAAKGKETKETEGTDTKNGNGKGKKDDLMTRLKKQADTMDAKLFKEADAIVAKITINLEQVAAAIKEAPLFAHLETHIKDASDINFEFATEIIPGIARDLSVRRGALGNMEQLHRKLTTPAARKKYQATLKKLLEKFKEPFEVIMAPLNKIEKAWPELQNSIPKSKQYAYFSQAEEVKPAETVQEDIEKQLQIIEKTAPSLQAGLEQAVSLIEEKKQPVDEKLAEAQQKIPTPVSLFEIKKNIEALTEMVKNFDQPPKEITPDQLTSKATINK